jgi:glycosyltransferase involved in cell wall biosynthesis
MSAGVPAVVSHDTGACEAIRDGIDGVVLSEYTPEYLDHKLAALVKTQSLRVESGFQAKKRISENFTVSNYMERIKQIHLRLQKEGAAWGKFIQHKSEARRVVE